MLIAYMHEESRRNTKTTTTTTKTQQICIITKWIENGWCYPFIALFSFQFCLSATPPSPLPLLPLVGCTFLLNCNKIYILNVLLYFIILYII